MSHRKMLLISLGLGAVPQFLDNQVEGKKLAFIPTAGGPYEDRSFIDRDRQLLRSMHFDLQDVDLAGHSSESLRQRLEDADVIFVSGGNSFYLLQKARESGFGDILKILLDRGVPYIGASAGAILVGPDLSPVDTLDDPTAAPGLSDFAGLGLVDFVVLPHYGVEKYLPRYQAIIKKYEQVLPLIPLKDDQAVLVTGSAHQMIESPDVAGSSG